MTVSTAPPGTARIARAFARARDEKRLAVVVYLTVGYPDRAATAGLLRAALDGGADVLELGVPFSDPLADGATVQRASEIALRQGVSLADCLAEAATIVRERDASVLLMGYANPFLRYRGGLAGLAEARHVDVAGLAAWCETLDGEAQLADVLSTGKRAQLGVGGQTPRNRDAVHFVFPTEVWEVRGFEPARHLPTKAIGIIS